jgi:hypothetical protein
MFIYWAIKHSKELWRVKDRARSGCLKSVRTEVAITTVWERIRQDVYAGSTVSIADNFESVCIWKCYSLAMNTWAISEVLHTVYFHFKNEFILQNTSTGLQCNLHCALSQRSNVWASLVFLSGRLRCSFF